MWAVIRGYEVNSACHGAISNRLFAPKWLLLVLFVKPSITTTLWRFACNTNQSLNSDNYLHCSFVPFANLSAMQGKAECCWHAPKMVITVLHWVFCCGFLLHRGPQATVVSVDEMLRKWKCLRGGLEWWHKPLTYNNMCCSLLVCWFVITTPDKEATQADFKFVKWKTNAKSIDKKWVALSFSNGSGGPT